jgi:hypothetical protein
MGVKLINMAEGVTVMGMAKIKDSGEDAEQNNTSPEENEKPEEQ